MKLFCDKNTLMNSINIAINAINTIHEKNTIYALNMKSIYIEQEISESFLLKAYNNKFVIMGNNFSIVIQSCNVEANIITEGEIWINAKIFSQVIKGLPTGELLIFVDSDKFVNINSGNFKFKIKILNVTKNIVVPTVEKINAVSIKGNIFSDMINKTIFSVSQENTNLGIAGGLIEVKNNELNLVTTDNYRISHMKQLIEKPCENMSIIVPTKSLEAISKVLNDDNSDILLFANDKNLLIESQKGTIITYLMDCKFLEYTNKFTEEYTCKITGKKELLLNCLEKSMLVNICSKRTCVKFIISGNKLIINSSTDISEISDEIFIEKDGEDFKIAFNPKYLIDVLQAIEEENITIMFTNPRKIFIVKGCSNNAYSYLILPMMVLDL